MNRNLAIEALRKYSELMEPALGGPAALAGPAIAVCALRRRTSAALLFRRVDIIVVVPLLIQATGHLGLDRTARREDRQ